jgi:hypothetical protein
MVDQEMTIDELVGVYLRIRNAIEAAEEKHKAEIQELKDHFELIGGKLLEICNEQNVDSIRTPVGTVSRRITSRYWTSDWDSMHRFILDNEAPFLLEQRIHNSNMRQFLEDNPDRLPAGLQNERKFTVQVRKPTSK